MKIKAKNSKIASMKLCVPVDGVISIDHSGVAEVSPKCAALLVKGTNDWEYLKKSAAKTEEEEKTSTDEVEEPEAEEEETEEDGKSDRERFEAYLDGLTVAQMKDYAKEGNLPAEEYDKLSSKKLMKAYLLKKYDEMAEKED
jgi:hypothetical protein|nr:MAG TPA: hypothetical protein [Caudoviricetes sp.]